MTLKKKAPGFAHQESSKLGDTVGSTQNMLASSVNASTAGNVDAAGRGADRSDLPSEAIQKEFDDREDHFDDEDLESNVFASESDELEMGTALLEEATQAPVTPTRDPSNALEEVEETTDDDRL
jgi:hypothetical protein